MDLPGSAAGLRRRGGRGQSILRVARARRHAAFDAAPPCARRNASRAAALAVRVSYATYARLSQQEKRQIEQVLAAYIKARGE